jgi:hypothetical protein
MKTLIGSIALLFAVSFASAQLSPDLVFTGYIDYPARHDYRIELYAFPSGLISKVITLSGEPQEKTEELVITQNDSRIVGIDKFQQNIKTIEIIKGAGSIRIIIENENTISHKKSRKTINVIRKQDKDLIFEDNEKLFLLQDDGTFRIEAKANHKDAVVVRGNQIFDDGWFRSDWKRDGDKISIKDFTTMEIPGDWITNGGGEMRGGFISAIELEVRIINYYILNNYLDVRTFIPPVFGLRTGSY